MLEQRHVDGPEANTVVSDNGDILSPKYAPLIMAPAIQPSSNPWARPMPMRAMPMVAMVVHELPVMTLTMADMMQVEAKNISGCIICMP